MVRLRLWINLFEFKGYTIIIRQSLENIHNNYSVARYCELFSHYGYFILVEQACTEHWKFSNPLNCKDREQFQQRDQPSTRHHTLQPESVRTETMTSQSNWFAELIHKFNDSSDPRTREWFLMSSPGTMVAIVSLYLYFCLSAGPRYMRNKAPYSLRTTLIVYNLSQVLISIYLVYEGLMTGWLFEYSWTCQPVDYSDNPVAIRMARAGHLYFLCKIVELLDTVFFVLRKKDRQVTFLHLYHHISMPLGMWFGIRFIPGGHLSLFGLLNSFVHVIMYSYYMLAALGPEIQKYLWWKKYLTLLQMIQFLIVGSHSALLFFTDCINFSKVWPVLVLLESVIFVYMFGSFYFSSYIDNNDSSKAVDSNEMDSHTSLKSD